MELKELHPKSKAVIEHKFNVIRYIDLFDYQFRFDVLEKELIDLKREFKDYERIVFYHFDTDYILGDISIMLYNFIRVLTQADIPLYFVMLATSTNCGPDIERMCDLFNVKPELTIIETACRVMHWNPEAVKDVEFNTKIIHKFSVMHSLHRFHRKVFAGWFTRNIGNEGNLVSFTHVIIKRINVKLGEGDGSGTQFGDGSYVYVPYRRVNDQWRFVEPMMADFAMGVRDYRNGLIFDGPNSMNTRYQNTLLECAFIDIVSETVFEYPFPFLTEKTFRAMNSKRPFIIIGAPGTLMKLHEMGFQTFSNHFDESYDIQWDSNKRMKAIFDLVTYLDGLTLDQMKTMLENMQPILEHNFEQYKKIR